MESNKMNLYQKLIEIRKDVKYAQKIGAGYKFSYATESQILAAIRPKMDELGVFLETDMLYLEPVEVTIAGSKESPTPRRVSGLKCSFKFSWVNAENPAEKIEKTLIVQDAESTIKTVGSLMTYANRYFLYKFFSVPTDKDDPDAFENAKAKSMGGGDRFLSEEQIHQISSLADQKRIEKICNTYASDMGLAGVEAKHFEFIMCSLTPKAVSS